MALRNIAGVAALVGIAYALWRRLVSRPPRLTLTRSGVLILLLIGAIIVGELGALSAEAAMHGAIPGAFITNAVGSALAGLPTQALEILFAICWWGHVIAVATFLVWLPSTKHLHVVTSFFNVFLRKLEPRGELPPMDLEAEDATYGLGTLADVGWKGLLDGFTCTECGRCQDACPAFATGKPLNPKAMIMGIRHLADSAEAGLNLIPNGPDVRRIPGMDDSIRPTAAQIPLIDGAISFDAVWDCVTCGGCVEACPVLIEHVDKIVGIRRNLVLEDSRFPQELTTAFRAMESQRNPWGQPASTRLDWAKGLPFTVPVAAELARAGRIGEVEVLWWVGCAAAYDDRARRVARAFATCLHAAGVRYAVLGTEEACTGDPARRAGNEYVFQMLAMQNVETLGKYGPPRIVTACPHCFNTLKNEYPDFGGKYEVVHHSVFLDELLKQGRLTPTKDVQEFLTFHDACYLGRYNKVYDEPRDVLLRLPGVRSVEMTMCRDRGFCCGAGGARMWMEEKVGEKVNHRRLEHVEATGATTVASACPYCLIMFDDAAKTKNREDLGRMDIAEILEKSV
jgi:Fe-S oxidoreductase